VFFVIRHHDVKRYREPARDLDQLVEWLKDADVVVSVRERVEFSRALLERLPKLKLWRCRPTQMIDRGLPNSGFGRDRHQRSPDAPAELTSP
jgi:D-3-phosphoglycerate dehydrogenase